ncbi:MAG: tRNA (adenosine(37)-N6)-dimethylallyltransferase MiaA [Proteobacteria bacterium]|nr:tRNA (adenosine(37)-N6)-dimethylallyltransferase MiaA [Pseudomonadota bacterium]
MQKIVIIVGPTASGKSSLAMEAALRFNGEIVGADSVQVYRQMNIGTAKPTPLERKRVPHHLIDILDPDEEYTVARFVADADLAIADICSRSRNAFVTGGTGLYIRSLVEGIFDGPEADTALREELLEVARQGGVNKVHDMLKHVDPESAEKIHPNNLRRVIRALEVEALTKRPISEFHSEHALKEKRYNALKIGLDIERSVLYKRIEGRVDKMVEAGLVAEVEGLLRDGYREDLKPMGALGYKEMVGYLNGEYPLDEAVRLLKRNTRRYAKKQLTWFKKDRAIEWYSRDDARIMKRVEEHLC